MLHLQGIMFLIASLGGGFPKMIVRYVCRRVYWLIEISYGLLIVVLFYPDLISSVLGLAFLNLL